MDITQEFIENLKDAGCNEQEIKEIMACFYSGDERNLKCLITKCRNKQLEILHDSQKCIDRLNFLSYQLEKDFAKGGRKDEL